ncbi:cytochrome c peroxidase [Paludisphaera rhizosphaerae]|uniref:cytochrome c peroxidase n=1 Tax=Paludisphaera rhizosphaerae TaxID=2711216 RepID=UPI0013ED3F81|nr:cytochrome c peroxidase [Paludisphaera rhizosphaerae]
MNLRSRAAAGLALAAIAALAVARVPAQTPSEQPASSSKTTPSPQPRAGARESAPTGGHLVGHEEAELLRRIQELIDDFDPRKLVSPYVEAVQRDDKSRPTKWVVKRPDLAQFIKDADAAVALGKAFFWEMQAGSDFRRIGDGKFVGTACASCHYRFGADPRDTNTARIPYVGWKEYCLDKDHKDLGFGEKQQPVDGLAKMIRANQESRRLTDAPAPPPAPEDAAGVATLRIDHPSDLKNPVPRGFPPHVRRRPPGLDADDEEDEAEDCDEDRRKTPLSLIVGSQGVEPRVFTRLVEEKSPEGTWWREESVLRSPHGFRRPPQWSMFVDKRPGQSRAFRQITTRNAPSVMNATFADRLFHDSRAESTFNGFSIFGDFDESEVLYVRRVDAQGRLQAPMKSRIAIPRAALASQAVGPIVNDVEMSYVGRTFHDLAYKLLDAEVLGFQMVSEDDSVFSRHRGAGWSKDKPGLGKTYRELIQEAFRPEWCDEIDASSETRTAFKVPLLLAVHDAGETPVTGTLMQADFSLYWGLSLMLYQSTLISNESPYDRMLRGSGDEVENLWRQKRSQLEPIYIDRVHSLARSPENCIPGETPPVVASTTNPKPPPATPRFAFNSGPEVFQRGLRSFLSRGCVDCHDGPLFSEVYLRGDQGENEPLKPLPIGRLVSNALLPDSRGDALAFKYVGARERVLERIGSTLADGGKPLLDRELLDFIDVCERDGGDEAALARSVNDLLKPFRTARQTTHPTDEPGHCLELAKLVAKEWTTFEKTFVERLGNRHFFREDERVARAGLIGVPVMVELMPIPQTLAAIRPRLPISGPLARGSYAFYDVSNYVIGAGLPRYDRGGGEWTELNAPEPNYPYELLEAFQNLLDKLPPLIADQRNRAPGISQAELERIVEGELEAFDRMSRSRFGVVAPRRTREAVMAMTKPNERDSQEKVAKLQDQVRSMTRTMAEARIDSSKQKLADDAKAQVAFGPAPKYSSAGAPGVAYQMRKGRSRSSQMFLDQPRRIGEGPWKNPLDADADSRASNPRDLSWHRNLPNWNNSPLLKPATPKEPNQPEGEAFDSVDARRADVHFFARSRAMVQDESSEGRRKPLLHDNELAFWGSFKTPTLRNVSLTAPYMHNGRLQSLVDVVDFYDCGGDVPADPVHNPDLAPAMLRLHMDEEEKLALVFFLMCLTDCRVEHEKAPFDHPSIRVVNGYDDQFSERIILVNAVGAGGAESSPKGFPDHTEPEMSAPPQP